MEFETAWTTEQKIINTFHISAKNHLEEKIKDKTALRKPLVNQHIQLT